MASKLATAEERFWSRVNKTDACWLWTGYRDPNGYGSLGVDCKNRLAHRFSFELHNGAIPAGLFICHKCDVPSCVNPNHLFAGTQKENMMDCSRKGRAPRQQNKTCAKGHERNEENSRYTESGRWYCRPCASESQRQNRLGKRKDIMPEVEPTTPIRIQRRRAKGFKMPANTVSVCRPGKWGNPYPVEKPEYGRTPAAAYTEAVERFKIYAQEKLAADPDWLAALRGKNLACFCSLDNPCHADILLRLANQ